MPEIDPPISVLMAVRNGGKYTAKAIESILLQDFSNFLFIIIDDASTDGTYRNVLSFNDSRIRLIRNRQRLGVTASLNKGLWLAIGKYIARMDADDISHADRLSLQYEYLEEHPEVAVLGTWARDIDSEGRVIGIRRTPTNKWELIAEIFFFNPIVHPTVMFRKDVVMKVGGYDPGIVNAQDYDLWLKILQRGGILANLPKILLDYRATKKPLVKQLNQKCSGAQSLANAYSHMLGISVRPEVFYWLWEMYDNRRISLLRRIIIAQLIVRWGSRIRKLFPNPEIDRLVRHRHWGIANKIFTSPKLANLTYHIMLKSTSLA